MSSRAGQLAFLGFLLLIPVLVFLDIGLRFVPEGMAGGRPESNAALYPGLVAALMGVLVLVEATRTGLASCAGRTGDDASDAGGAEARGHIARPRFTASARRSIALLVVFVLYLPAFRYLGFAISTIVFLVACQWVLGLRKPVLMLLFALGVTGAIWLAFAEGLDLLLPRGELFG